MTVDLIKNQVHESIQWLDMQICSQDISYLNFMYAFHIERDNNMPAANPCTTEEVKWKMRLAAVSIAFSNLAFLPRLYLYSFRIDYYICSLILCACIIAYSIRFYCFANFVFRRSFSVHNHLYITFYCKLLLCVYFMQNF